MNSYLNIDKLEIACNPLGAKGFLEQFLEQECNFRFQFFSLQRVLEKSNYKSTFLIFDAQGLLFGKLYFGSYNITRQHIYISVDNKALYLGSLSLLYNIIGTLRLGFHSVSKLDLAFDSDFNVISRFYKCIKNRDINLVILNKKYRINDGEILNLLNVTTGSRRCINKFKSFYIKNREKGLSLQAYDKLKEIADNDYEKQYIIDKLKCKKLYRLEVRTNHKLLIDSLNKIDFTDDYLLQLIIDNEYQKLFRLYCVLLNRLIHIECKNKQHSLLEYIAPNIKDLLYDNN